MLGGMKKRSPWVPLLASGLAALGLAAAFTLTSRPTAEARCALADGFGLERVGSGPLGPGGTLLVRLVPVFDASSAVPLPLTAVTLRGPDGSARASTTPQPLAANLYAIELPRAPGRLELVPGGLAVEVAAGGAAPAVPRAAPSLGAPPMTWQRAGRRSDVRALALAAPPPADAVGVVLRWGGGSWFLASGESRLGPPRCTPEVPGYAPVSVGERVSARFVGAGGGLSPESTFAAPE
jgi:hypothetical protein